MKTHELKLDINYFEDVKSGLKNFEIRRNDRDFRVGDILELKKYKSYKNGKRSHYIRTDMESKFKTYNPSRADTIKVKVLEMFKSEEINPDLKIVNDREYVMNLYIVLFLKGVSNVLKDYFNTDKVPDGYVVMAIEVIE